MSVDHRTGVMVWCVTGPLRPRQGGFKDVGYYIAEGYEGLITESRCEIKIGMRYFFPPEMCMLQWRHSGLVNYLSRTGKELQVRAEGLCSRSDGGCPSYVVGPVQRPLRRYGLVAWSRRPGRSWYLDSFNPL